LLAEILLAALTAAVLAALVARVPPALLQQAFQAVRAARPSLLAALAAAFLGRTAEASLEELAARIEGSEEFEALASSEAEQILEELVPPPALRCPELEAMVRGAIDRLQTCSEPERPSCCEHAELVLEGVSEELSTLERAYGEAGRCGATADLLARLRELHEAQC
jgi:hypothetical protein